MNALVKMAAFYRTHREYLFLVEYFDTEIAASLLKRVIIC